MKREGHKQAANVLRLTPRGREGLSSMARISGLAEAEIVRAGLALLGQEVFRDGTVDYARLMPLVVAVTMERF